MDGAGTVRAESGQVLGRGVALVGGKTVLWVLVMQLVHHTVARHLGDNGGRRNGDGAAVSLHDGGLLDREGVDRQPVDERHVRPQGQGGDSVTHGLVRGAEYV